MFGRLLSWFVNLPLWDVRLPEPDRHREARFDDALRRREIEELFEDLADVLPEQCVGDDTRVWHRFVSDHVKEMQERLNRMRNYVDESGRINNCWMWETGRPAQDQLENLTCPVLIAPEELLYMAKKAKDAERLQEAWKDFCDAVDFPPQLKPFRHMVLMHVREKMGRAKIDAQTRKDLYASYIKVLHERYEARMKLKQLNGSVGKGRQLLVDGDTGAWILIQKDALPGRPLPGTVIRIESSPPVLKVLVDGEAFLTVSIDAAAMQTFAESPDEFVEAEYASAKDLGPGHSNLDDSLHDGWTADACDFDEEDSKGGRH